MVKKLMPNFEGFPGLQVEKEFSEESEAAHEWRYGIQEKWDTFVNWA
jgi:hypothetical protein